MTTLLGLVVKKNNKVILASDLALTYDGWEQQGDHAFRTQWQKETPKIFVDKAGDIAVCGAGAYDDLYMGFMEDLTNGKIDFRNAIKSGMFPEFLDLNLKRCGYKVPAPKMLNSMLVASRYDGKPTLYTCFPMGRVEPREDFCAVGSGSDHVYNYMRTLRSKGHRDLGDISLESGLQITVSALESAAADLYTKGLDIAVVSKENVRQYGDKIRQSLDDAKRRVLEEILKDNSIPTQPDTQHQAQ